MAMTRHALRKWGMPVLLLAVVLIAVAAVLLGTPPAEVTGFFTTVFVTVALVMIVLFALIMVAGFVGIRR